MDTSERYWVIGSCPVWARFMGLRPVFGQGHGFESCFGPGSWVWDLFWARVMGLSPVLGQGMGVRPVLGQGHGFESCFGPGSWGWVLFWAMIMGLSPVLGQGHGVESYFTFYQFCLIFLSMGVLSQFISCLFHVIISCSSVHYHYFILKYPV